MHIMVVPFKREFIILGLVFLNSEGELLGDDDKPLVSSDGWDLVSDGTGVFDPLVLPTSE